MQRLILSLVRYAVILRHPRLTYWYWQLDESKRLPNPAIPKTANDKFFWRKIFDRNDEFTTVSDKLRVNDWLIEKGIYVDKAPVLWSGTDPATIPDEILASGVVAKVNHGSSTNIVLPEAPSDRAAFNKQMLRYLRKPQGRKKLEWGYFNIQRKLFVEALIPDLIAEFKIYTFGDRIERIQIVYDPCDGGGKAVDVWLPDGQTGWRRFEGSPKITRNANRPWPSIAESALEISRTIGSHFDHMRVDLLFDENQLWLGELTVYSLAGHIYLVGDVPEEGVNTSWDICRSRFMSTPQKGWKKRYADSLRKVIRS